ncbi:hypothetical protein K501DRAFT_329003 [Backusella circina FSU 941]|nr:hypothetical protein K501DRAFT_329003 [Backusella circina FSU 941]
MPKAGLFECKSCKLTFPQRASLKGHKNDYHVRKVTLGIPNGEGGFTKYNFTRDEQDMFCCMVCEKSYSSASGLRNHLTQKCKSSGEQHKCTECGQIYKSRRSLMGHIHENHVNDVTVRLYRRPEEESELVTISRNQDNVFECPYCPQVNSTPKVMTDHINTCTSNKNKPDSLECPDCGKAIFGQNKLQIHIGNFHKETYTLKIDLKEGRKEFDILRNTEGVLECPLCSKGFKHRGNLNVHMNHLCPEIKKERKSQYHCEKCPQTYDNEHQMNVHMLHYHCAEVRLNYKTKSDDWYCKTVKRDPEGYLDCPSCDKHYRCVLHLTGHIRAITKCRTIEIDGEKYKYTSSSNSRDGKSSRRRDGGIITVETPYSTTREDESMGEEVDESDAIYVKRERTEMKIQL